MTDAILFGAGDGIGAAVLERLSARSIRTVVFGRTAPPPHPDVVFHPIDLADSESLRQISEESMRRSVDGPARTLIVNSGGSAPGSLAETGYDEFLRITNLNLIGPAMAIRALLPQLRLGSPSRVVLIGSTAARQGVASLSAYSSAKAGLLALTASLARELANDGIRVTCVVPGAVLTASASRNRAELDVRAGRDPGSLETSMLASTGLDRLVTPSEVGRVVEWLALDAPEAVTGQSLNVSGLTQVW